MSHGTYPHNEPAGRLSFLVAGLYAWAAAVSFGMVVLDVLYANLVPKAVAASSEVADFLLLTGAVTVLAAFGAIGASWNSQVARSLFAASLVIIIVGFFAPALLSPLLQTAPRSALGPGIRMAIGGLASILAFMGLHALCLHDCDHANAHGQVS
jgi:hypothetical protein